MESLMPSWILRNKGCIRQVLVCCSVSLLTFVVGMQIVWPSLAIERIANGDAGFKMTREQLSMVVSASSLTICLVPIFLGPLSKKFGRKTNLCLNAFIFCVVWGLITFARSPWYLVLANVVSGFGSAILIIIGPIYIGEIADKRIRGALISMYITAMAIGEVFSTGVGIFIPYFQLNLIALVLSVAAFFLITILATESPAYHLMINDEAKAQKSFRYYWNYKKTTEEEDKKEVQAALAELKESVELEMKSSSSYLELFRTPGNFKASIIVIGLSIFQATSGVVAMLVYASTTLPKYDGFFQPNPTMAAVNFLDLFFNIVSTVLVDKIGRKPLTIISNAGGALGTGIMALYFFIEERTSLDTTDIKWIPYVGILIFISAYGSAMATMPHLLVGELFPVNVRYHASMLSGLFIAFTFFIINYSYLWVCQYLGVFVMYSFFTVCSIIATVFSYVYMFETKNLSLAEIQEKVGEKERVPNVESK